MPRTRSGAASNKESAEEEPRKEQPHPQNSSKKAAKSRKRSSADRPETSIPAPKMAKTEPKSEEANGADTRKRLTTPDLEYDYDRSQLRDPRQTPGRVGRPRRTNIELSAEWKAQFYIPEPKKPAGRLNAFQKNELFRERALLDPSATFHDLYVCHRKGRDGSPEYDSAGFQLDWHKVDRWMKPQPYNKNAMVRAMGKAVDKAVNDNRQMHEIFFENGTPPTGVDGQTCEHYMKDQVSKDLGIPMHQITPAHFRDWERSGFTKAKADQWWREPNAEEMKRASNMVLGASLRKDL